MIANWMEGSLILTPEKDKDQQTLKALAAACEPMVWDAVPPQGVADQGGPTLAKPEGRRLGS